MAPLAIRLPRLQPIPWLATLAVGLWGTAAVAGVRRTTYIYNADGAPVSAPASATAHSTSRRRMSTG